MERGAPFSHFQLPKSDPGLNLDQHNSPNPTVTSDADNKNIVVEPQTCMVREQDQFMPIANVIRIMRRMLPQHAKISDDAKETIQECVSEFISFVTGEANERCQREQRKTITAEDILWAMGKLGFEDYVGPLTVFINRYREFETDRGCSLRGESFKPAYSGNGIGFHAPPPPGPYGYGMLDQSMVMGGGGRYSQNGSSQDGGSGSSGARYYQNGSGQDGAGGGSGSSSSMSGMSVFDPYAPGMKLTTSRAIKKAARCFWPLNYLGLVFALAVVLVFVFVNLYVCCY